MTCSDTYECHRILRFPIWDLNFIFYCFRACLDQDCACYCVGVGKWICRVSCLCICVAPNWQFSHYKFFCQYKIWAGLICIQCKVIFQVKFRLTYEAGRNWCSLSDVCHMNILHSKSRPLKIYYEETKLTWFHSFKNRSLPTHLRSKNIILPN